MSAAEKSAARKDAYYAAGCCFRSVSCLNQVLFAINEHYCMNEKGAVDIIDSFRTAPPRYRDRVNEAFTLISPNETGLAQAIQLLGGITREVEQLTLNK